MSDGLITLNCLLLGDPPSEIFEIDIAKTRTVSSLKKAAQKEMEPALDHRPANKLTLWKVETS